MLKNPDTALSDAVRAGRWNKARHLAAIRIAEMMEQTESPRETKSLAISLAEYIQECENADVSGDYSNTPLEVILAEATKAD